MLPTRNGKEPKDFIFPAQLGSGFLTTINGWQELDDWFSLARTLPTIKDELGNLPQPSDMRKTIYSIHMPPTSLGLDILLNERSVGSKAVKMFLEEKQPLISLHGHIHESYKMTSIWKAHLKNTICIQPGQDGFEPAYVIIDTGTMKIERYGHEPELMMIYGK